MSFSDLRQENLATAEQGTPTQLQEPRSTALNNVSVAIESLIPINDRITRHAESQDEAEGLSQTTRTGENEQEIVVRQDSGEADLERKVPQPRMTGGIAEAGQGHQTEAERHRETKEETKVHSEDNSRGSMQIERDTDKATEESGSHPAATENETATSKIEQTLKSAATPTANSISPDSSLNLSAPSISPPRDRASSAAGAEVPAISSLPALWNGSDRRSPNPRPTSLPLPMLTRTVSPSRRHRRHQSEMSSEQAFGVVSVVPVKSESPAPSARLRAHLSSESLSTISSLSVSSDGEGNEDLSTVDSVSVGSTWEGTIIDMECKSVKAKGGHRVFFQAKLDTAARRDVLSQKIVDRLGIRVRVDRKGRTFQVVGDGPDTTIKPLGFVILNLRGVGREQRLKLKFYVIADSDVRQTFDCLFGCATSRKHFLALMRDGNSEGGLVEGTTICE